MSAVSQSQLTNNDKVVWTGERERDLFISFLLLESPDEVRDFLLDILTETELQNAVKRWCVVRGLIDQGSSGKIEVDCFAHRNTVSAARKHVIKSGTGICRTIHQRLLAYKSKNASHE